MDGEVTLADAARLYGISYAVLNHRRLKLSVQPVKRVGNCRVYTHAQIRELIADLAGEVVSQGGILAGGAGPEV